MFNIKDEGFSKRKKWVWLPIIAAVGLLILLSIQNIDMPGLIEVLSNTNYYYILLSCLPIIGAGMVQSFRWRVAVKGIDSKPDYWSLFRAMMAGNALNNLFPRGGEFFRPYIYAKHRKLKYTSMLATAGLDRFYDLVGMIFFMLLVAIAKKDTFQAAFPVIELWYIIIAGILLTVLILLFFIYLIKSSKPEEIIARIFKKLPGNYSETAKEKWVSFIKGLQIVQSRKAHFKMFLWTLILWFIHALNLWIAFWAFDFQYLNPLDIFDAFALLIAISIGITILPVPGGTGVQHYVVKSMLILLFAINSEAALAFAALNHASIFFVNLIVGLLCIIPDRKYLS